MSVDSTSPATRIAGALATGAPAAPALRRRAEALRRHQIKLAAALAVGVATAWLFGARPMTQTLADLRARAAETRAALDQDRLRAEQLPALMADVQGLRRQVDRFKALPPRADLPQAYQDIGAIGGFAPVRAYRYSPDAERRTDLFIEQPFKVSFDGTFDAAYSLVNRLETMERLTRLRELKVTRKDPRSGDVSVEMTLSLFFSEQ